MRENLFAGLRQQDPEFGSAVEKWWPKMSRIASDMANLTGHGVEDLLQDLLLVAWQATSEYRKEYEGPRMSLASYIYVQLAWWKGATTDRYMARFRTGVRVSLEDSIPSRIDVEQDASDRILWDRCETSKLTGDMQVVVDALKNADLLALLPPKRKASALMHLQWKIRSVGKDTSGEVHDFA